MATPVHQHPPVCSTCGEPLNAKGECVACLLRTAFDESVVETKRFGLVSLRRLRGRATPRRLLLGTRSRRHGGDLSRHGQGVASQGRSESDRGAGGRARDSQAMRERFLREARAAAALRHPNVAAVSSSALRRMPLTAITQWSWSRAKLWRLACGGMVRLMQKRLWKLQSKSRGH